MTRSSPVSVILSCWLVLVAHSELETAQYTTKSPSSMQRAILDQILYLASAIQGRHLTNMQLGTRGFVLGARGSLSANRSERTSSASRTARPQRGCLPKGSSDSAGSCEAFSTQFPPSVPHSLRASSADNSE
ncbi:hypothetical protein BKA80DRAFT_270222 [Phyllosticta citrichinensis]